MVWLWLAGCADPTPQWCEARGTALGTTWSVKWEAMSCRDDVHTLVADTLASVDAQMSTWREDSELSRARAASGPVEVSAETASVVRAALDLARDSGGAFDPTVQPLMEVWGFHSKDRSLAAPTPEALEAARAQVGWDRVVIQGTQLDTAGTALDLSAIAKGHAVDRVSIAISAHGHRNHLVEVGGEVRAMGAGPRGSWTLGVDVPEEGTAPGTAFAAKIQISDQALATSGNYRNLVEVDGTQVHHTMDPRTGRPAVTDVASASIVAPTCEAADGLATAVMVLGSDEGLAMVEKRPAVEAFVIVSTPEGLVHRQTSGMAALLVD